MSKISEREWIDDFQEFVGSKGVAVPASVSEAVLSQVARDLNPSPWRVFVKLLGVHAVVGTLSLGVCNQFGMSPFATGFSLSDYFMKFGHSTCMVLCGVLFIGLSVLLGGAVLNREEVRVLRAKAVFEVMGLSVLSLGLLLAAGAEVALVIGLLWLAGAMVGGLASTRLLSRARLSLRPGTNNARTWLRN